MSPAVRWVGYVGLILFAVTVTVLMWGCRSRWRWFQGFVVDEDLAAGDASGHDEIDEIIARINVLRAGRGKPPLTRAGWPEATRYVLREIEHIEETGRRT